MTGLDKPLKVPLLIKKGRSAVFTVQPLTAPAPARDFLAEARLAGGDARSLRALWLAAQQAGAAQEVLDKIRSMATPADENPPA